MRNFVYTIETSDIVQLFIEFVGILLHLRNDVCNLPKDESVKHACKQIGVIIAIQELTFFRELYSLSLHLFCSISCILCYLSLVDGKHWLFLGLSYDEAWTPISTGIGVHGWLGMDFTRGCGPRRLQQTKRFL